MGEQSVREALERLSADQVEEQQIRDGMTDISQEHISKRTGEQLDEERCHVERFMEDLFKVARSNLQGFSQRTVVQVVNVPVPQIKEQIVQVGKVISQKRLFERMVEQCVDYHVHSVYGRNLLFIVFFRTQHYKPRLNSVANSGACSSSGGQHCPSGTKLGEVRKASSHVVEHVFDVSKVLSQDQSVQRNEEQVRGVLPVLVSHAVERVLKRPRSEFCNDAWNNDNDNDTLREVPHPSNEGLA